MSDHLVLIDHPPAWFLEQVPWHKYTAWLAMSTVSVNVNFHNYSPNVIWYMLSAVHNVAFEDGTITKVSTATKTTDIEDLEPPKPAPPKRGRDSINPHQERKRPHGNYAAFGWSVEVKLSIPLAVAFKGQTVRPYTIKIFSNKIQVPGCYTEDYSDVFRIANFIIRLLREAYSCVPEPPASFQALQKRLVVLHEQPLFYARASDFNGVQIGKRETYSRNYVVHGPLVTDNDALAANNDITSAVHLRDMHAQLMNSDRDLIQEWATLARLNRVDIEYVATSENTSRRLQFIFYTPQIQGPNDRIARHHITKAFFESSGKINIELTNNYEWPDVLWRIIAFLNHLFDESFYKKRMITPSSTKDPRYAEFFREFISDDKIREYIVSLMSDDSGGDD
jgi:hypothetical protein